MRPAFGRVAPKKMQFINLTPHAVNVGATTFQPDGTVARVSEKSELIDRQDGIDLFAVRFGEVVGLPAPVDGVRFIVSTMVKAACPQRTDLCVPFGLIRNTEGQVVGCKGFSV